MATKSVHDITAAESTGAPKRDPKAVIGSFADVADVMEQVSEAAMAARERDPLRLPNG